MLATEAFRMLSAAATAHGGAKPADWWARGIALAAAFISLLSLGFTIGKEWWRGRRVSVTVSKSDMGTVGLYVVKINNKGGLPVYVIDWGYDYTAGRGPGRSHTGWRPGSTGINGPELPNSLPAGQDILLNTGADDVETAVEGRPKKYLRGYVVISSSTRRRYSKPIRLH